MEAGYEHHLRRSDDVYVQALILQPKLPFKLMVGHQHHRSKRGLVDPEQIGSLKHTLTLIKQCMEMLKFRDSQHLNELKIAAIQSEGPCAP